MLNFLFLCLLKLLTGTIHAQSCHKCSLKFECWNDPDGVEDGLIEYKEIDKLDGCVRAEVVCNTSTKTAAKILRVGNYLSLKPVELVCQPDGKWSPYNADTVACAVAGRTDDGKVFIPSCLTVAETIFDGTDTGDIAESKLGGCRSCPVDVGCNTGESFNDGLIDWKMSRDKEGCLILDAECGFSDGSKKSDDVMQLFVGKYAFDKKVRLQCNENGHWVPGEDQTFKCGVFRSQGEVPSDLAAKATCNQPKPIKVPGQEEEETTTTTLATATTSDGGCCGVWSEWTEVTPCADTCGSCGVQRVRRRCTSEECNCEGKSEEIRYCNRQPCRIPRTSCCDPFRVQVEGKKILCGTKADKTIEVSRVQCDRGRCCPEKGVWSEWQPYGTCSGMCGGFGSSKRKRVCLSEPMGCKCTGPDHDNGPCSLEPCNIKGWSKCRAGFLPRKRGYDTLCSDLVPRVDASDCCEEDGIWDEWSEWTKCSTNCGGCSKSRRWRDCASASVGCPCKGQDKEEEPCNTEVCESKPHCCNSLSVVVYAGNVLCWKPERAVHEQLPNHDVLSMTLEDYTRNLVAMNFMNNRAMGKWSAWKGRCTADCGLCGNYIRSRECLGPGECSGNYKEELSNACPKLACKNQKPCCKGHPKEVNGFTICVI